MTREEMEIKYREIILPESRDDTHFHSMEDPTRQVEAYNALCGDKYSLYLLEKDGNFVDASFEGIGCAISRASTSILVQHIEGCSIDEAKRNCELFLEGIDTGEFAEIGDEKIKLLLELRNFEGRMDCIRLSWKALLDELNDQEG